MAILFCTKNFFGNMYKKRAHTRHKTEQIFLYSQSKCCKKMRRPQLKMRGGVRFAALETSFRALQQNTKVHKRPRGLKRGQRTDRGGGLYCQKLPAAAPAAKRGCRASNVQLILMLRDGVTSGSCRDGKFDSRLWLEGLEVFIKRPKKA